MLYGIPLMLDAEKASVIDAVFRSHVAGAPIAFNDFHRPAPVAMSYAAEEYSSKPYAVTKNGVAIIPITGSLVHRTSGMNAQSGLQSYQEIDKLFASAVADSDVKAIMMEIDSSGGHAAGVFELAKKIRKKCSDCGKPLWAHANEMALSAGYALASVADRVTLPNTGFLGSIGVIAMHVDQSKKNEKDGYEYTTIIAGGKKAYGSPHAPLSDEARRDLQSRVNAVYQTFVEHVAKMRGLSVDAVREQDAGIYTGQAAVDAGLADAVMSFNDALAALEEKISAKPAIKAAQVFRRQSTLKGVAMENESVAEVLTAEQVAAQIAAARKEGAAEMQARIRSIMECDEAVGRNALAKHLAFNTGMSVDEAKALLSVSAKEAPPSAASQVNALAEAMAKLANPALGADAPTVEADEKAMVASLWNRSNQKLLAVK